jgi:hypothetical protein
MKRTEPLFTIGQSVQWSDSFGRGQGIIIRSTWIGTAWLYQLKIAHGTYSAWEFRLYIPV